MKRFNSRGVAHWIFPAIAVLVVGGIGAYVLTSSKAASTTLYTKSGVMTISACVSKYYANGTTQKQLNIKHRNLSSSWIYNVSTKTPVYSHNNGNVGPYTSKTVSYSNPVSGKYSFSYTYKGVKYYTSAYSIYIPSMPIC